MGGAHQQLNRHPHLRRRPLQLLPALQPGLPGIERLPDADLRHGQRVERERVQPVDHRVRVPAQRERERGHPAEREHGRPAVDCVGMDAVMLFLFAFDCGM